MRADAHVSRFAEFVSNIMLLNMCRRLRSLKLLSASVTRARSHITGPACATRLNFTFHSSHARRSHTQDTQGVCVRMPVLPCVLSGVCSVDVMLDVSRVSV